MFNLRSTRMPLVAALVAVAALAGGCASGPDVRGDYDRAVDFGKYKTYNFLAAANGNPAEFQSIAQHDIIVVKDLVVDMDEFFGKDDADRFRRQELQGKLAFLPYGVAVDHFQHLVYAEPQATAQRRREMWQEMERTYLPWRNYGGMPHASQGGMWQAQSHIYGAPFYYIDYVLAETCAMQFWVRADNDRATAMKDYVALCGRGGEASFQSLVRGAGGRDLPDHGELWSQHPVLTLTTDEAGHRAHLVWTGERLPYRFERTVVATPAGEVVRTLSSRTSLWQARHCSSLVESMAGLKCNGL